MQFGWLAGKYSGKYSGVGFVEISKIFETQDAVSLLTKPTDRLYDNI